MRASPEELLKTECGTRSYMAPEVLARQQVSPPSLPPSLPPSQLRSSIV